ncbi:MAG TPA: hypothetical protein DD730_03010 [Desulfosporosinus sp.]|nr:hypothetical protein [Desulfosporosinus sp.]
MDTVGKRLFLRFTTEKSELMDVTMNILKRYPGKRPVYFYFENTRKVIEGKREYWVNDEHDLEAALGEVMGQRNVVWKPAKNFA